MARGKAENKWSVRVGFPDGLVYRAESSVKNPTAEQVINGLESVIETLKLCIKDRQGGPR